MANAIMIVCSTILVLLSLDNVFCESPISIDLPVLQQIINALTDNDKEKILQSLLDARENTGRQDNSNWCCNMDPGVEASSQTRQTLYYAQRHSRVKCGYSSCGVFGWSSCTRWCDNYWSEAQNGVETYLVYQARLCPAANLVCCSGYISVVNHCFSYDEVGNNKDVLSALVALGIPINPTMG